MLSLRPKEIDGTEEVVFVLQFSVHLLTRDLNDVILTYTG